MVTTGSFRSESASWYYQCHLLSLPFLLPTIWTFDCLPWSNSSVHMSTSILIRNSGKHYGRNRVRCESCQWILIISSIPDPSTAWIVWYPNRRIATNNWYKHVCFSWHGSRSRPLQCLSLLVHYSWAPCPLGSCCPFQWGWGTRQWSQTSGRVYTIAHTKWQRKS